VENCVEFCLETCVKTCLVIVPETAMLRLFWQRKKSS
jgi:hypothetical protein